MATERPWMDWMKQWIRVAIWRDRQAKLVCYITLLLVALSGTYRYPTNDIDVHLKGSSVRAMDRQCGQQYGAWAW